MHYDMLQLFLDIRLKGQPMNRLILSTFVAFSFAAFLSSPVHAQNKKASPHETVSTVVEGNRVTLVYGRPYTKDPKSGEARKIWGVLVPYGKVWRLGADEATMLVTQKGLDFGGKQVPAGAYTLFLQPEENGAAHLIVSKQLGQWGTQYEADNDLVRVEAKKEAADAKADQLTMAVAKAPGGGVITITWEDTKYSFPFTVAK